MCVGKPPNTTHQNGMSCWSYFVLCMLVNLQHDTKMYMFDCGYAWQHTPEMSRVGGTEIHYKILLVHIYSM